MTEHYTIQVGPIKITGPASDVLDALATIGAGAEVIAVQKAHKAAAQGEAPPLFKSTMDMSKAVHNEELRVSYGVWYPANKLDSAGEFMKADDLEGAVHKMVGDAFETSGFIINAEHGRVLQGAKPVEAAIYRGPGFRYRAADGSEGEFRKGDAVGAIYWADHWDDAKAGKYPGPSIEGVARQVKVTP